MTTKDVRSSIVLMAQCDETRLQLDTGGFDPPPLKNLFAFFCSDCLSLITIAGRTEMGNRTRFIIKLLLLLLIINFPIVVT